MIIRCKGERKCPLKSPLFLFNLTPFDMLTCFDLFNNPFMQVNVLYHVDTSYGATTQS